MIATESKKSFIKEFGKNEKDTGSTEVQIALLDARIKDLTDHFKTHAKDAHSRVGLLRVVSKRKKLLNYLKNNNLNAYNELIKKLGIRK